MSFNVKDRSTEAPSKRLSDLGEHRKFWVVCVIMITTWKVVGLITLQAWLRDLVYKENIICLKHEWKSNVHYCTRNFKWFLLTFEHEGNPASTIHTFHAVTWLFFIFNAACFNKNERIWSVTLDIDTGTLIFSFWDCRKSNRKMMAISSESFICKWKQIK